MIYCQLRERCKVDITAELRLKDVAQVLTEGSVSMEIPLHCPKKPGVWNVSALIVAAALKKACPQEDVTLLGPVDCAVHRVNASRKDPLKFLRVAAAFGILLLGSALGLAWFHSDVDMPKAQVMVYELIAGQPPSDKRLITIPYIIGVGLGVCVFYAIPRRNAVTPLEVKLTQYQSDQEKTEGKDANGDDG